MNGATVFRFKMIPPTTTIWVGRSVLPVMSTGTASMTFSSPMMKPRPEVEPIPAVVMSFLRRAADSGAKPFVFVSRFDSDLE